MECLLDLQQSFLHILVLIRLPALLRRYIACLVIAVCPIFKVFFSEWPEEFEIHAEIMYDRLRIPNEIYHWVSRQHSPFVVGCTCWSLLWLLVWSPIMKWILTPPSLPHLLAMGCNGQREYSWCIQSVYIIYLFIVFWSLFLRGISFCDFSYIITVGAVTALCSTLMGSILPQVHMNFSLVQLWNCLAFLQIFHQDDVNVLIYNPHYCSVISFSQIIVSN